ncbi:TetR/AcrR family transcriptional regulator [Embleya sp. NBC_00896]|uniref:TetR/AcrR family transcriptional regulator n=1 Tax=Embleya sp. NBC_00896 TaxID=2975961 RepID=UPI00386DDD8A|nr:TetR/AcrR family transcriptional regulator [Embleya sp. NBC_00896]
MTPTIEGPRARFREQTRAEIKEIALRQLADGGMEGVALTRIAKQLGMSGPALYRYFASRDDLLSALIRDAYDDLASAIEAAATAAARKRPRARLHALGAAHRGWAVEQPHRYLLIAGTPLPGYTAPPDTLLRARAALAPFLTVYAEGVPSPSIAPVVGQMQTWARDEPAVRAWLEGAGGAAGDPDNAGPALAGAVLTWTQLHGIVGLEVAGQFTGMGHTAPILLASALDTLADGFGLA